MLNATDKFLVNDGSTTETIAWSDMKAGINPLIVSVVIVPDEPVVNNEITATPVMTGGEDPYTVDSYQWHTSDDDSGTNQVDIPGATESTYTPVAADANKLLGCTITATDANNSTVSGTGYASILTDLGLVLAQPSVLTPPDGAGVGGDKTYTPKTSAIKADGVEEAPNYIAWAADTTTGGQPVWDNYPNIKTYVPGGTMTITSLEDYGNNTTLMLYASPDGVTWSVGGNWAIANELPAEYTDYSKQIRLAVTGGSDISTATATITEFPAETKLTLTNDKAYDAADNSEVSTIDKTFKAGDKVVGDGNVVFADSPAFSTTLYTGDGTELRFIETGIDNTDKAMVWFKARNTTYNHLLSDTLMGPTNHLFPNTTNAIQGHQGAVKSYDSNGITVGNYGYVNQSFNYVCWNFRAAPGFFDIVTYEGNGTGGLTIPHSLGSKPGMMIVKNLDETREWAVYHQDIGATRYLTLNENYAQSNENIGYWNNTEPTETEFTVGTSSYMNENAKNFVAYLFADTPGVVKCGSYRGNGSTQSIDCGFRPGWLLVKCYSHTKGWYIVDAIRGTDKTLEPNNNGTESTYANTPTFTATGFDLGSLAAFNEASKDFIYIAIVEDASAGEFLPTGVLTEDAAGTSMTLTDVTGTWAAGLTAVNETEVTDKAPGAADIIFTSSQPATTQGDVTTWGQAEWQLSTDSLFANKQEASVILANTNPEQGPTSFTLEDDTEYWVRTRYNSADPAAGPSEWSESNKFQTAVGAPPDGYNTALAPAQQPWTAIHYANNMFVSCAATTAADNVMWSDDGENWTLGSGAFASWTWRNIAYGDGVWVMVANQGSSANITRSTDGKTWSHSGMSGLTGGKTWFAVAYGAGKFVAFNSSDVSTTGNIVYSTDGLNWQNSSITAPTGANYWKQIIYANNKFTAIAASGSGNNQIWHSTDGLSWTNSGVSGVPSLSYQDICYGNGKYVAVASSSNQVISSTDGLTWSSHTLPGSANVSSHLWNGVTYGNGVYFAVGSNDASEDSSGKYFMYSTDGENWNLTNSPGSNAYQKTTYGGDKFVTVASLNRNQTEINNQIVWSYTGKPVTLSYYDENEGKALSAEEVTLQYGVDPLETDLRKFGIFPLTEQPTYSVAAYVPENGHYKPVRSYEDEFNRANSRLAEIKQAFADRLNTLEVAATAATEPFEVDGYYPLYYTEEAANAASDTGTNHSHTLNGVEYYMPDGPTIYHGDYGDSDY